MTMRKRLGALALGAGLLFLAPSAALAADPQPASPAPAPSEDGAERARWQQRALDARQRVEAAEAKLAAAEAAVTHMRARRYPRGDAAAAVEQDVETAKQELSDARKAQADLEDEARRAGVAPGWIRLDDED